MFNCDFGRIAESYCVNLFVGIWIVIRPLNNFPFYPRYFFLRFYKSINYSSFFGSRLGIFFYAKIIYSPYFCAPIILYPRFSSVILLAQHLTISGDCFTAFVPRFYMISFHFFYFKMVFAFFTNTFLFFISLLFFAFL